MPEKSYSINNSSSFNAKAEIESSSILINSSGVYSTQVLVFQILVLLIASFSFLETIEKPVYSINCSGSCANKRQCHDSDEVYLKNFKKEEIIYTRKKCNQKMSNNLNCKNVRKKHSEAFRELYKGNIPFPVLKQAQIENEYGECIDVFLSQTDRIFDLKETLKKTFNIKEEFILMTEKDFLFNDNFIPAEKIYLIIDSQLGGGNGVYVTTIKGDLFFEVSESFLLLNLKISDFKFLRKDLFSKGNKIYISHHAYVCLHKTKQKKKTKEKQTIFCWITQALTSLALDRKRKRDETIIPNKERKLDDFSFFQQHNFLNWKYFKEKNDTATLFCSNECNSMFKRLKIVNYKKFLEEKDNFDLCIKHLNFFVCEVDVTDRMVLLLRENEMFKQNIHSIFNNILNIFDSVSICRGIIYDTYCDLLPPDSDLIHRGIKFKILVNKKKKIIDRVIRHKECHFFINDTNKQCEHCLKYNTKLKTQKSYWKKDWKNANLKYLSHADLTNKCKELVNENESLKIKLSSLKEEIENLKNNFISFEKGKDDEFINIIKKAIDEDLIPKESFLRILIIDQIKSLSQRKSNCESGMRWNPEVIKWCLRLYCKGGKSVYDVVGGCIQLPSKRLIRSYKHVTEFKPGWNEILIQEMQKQLKEKKLSGIGGITFDGIKIHSGLVFSSSTDELIGFTDLGEGWNESYKEQIEKLRIANKKSKSKARKKSERIKKQKENGTFVSHTKNMLDEEKEQNLIEEMDYDNILLTNERVHKGKKFGRSSFFKEVEEISPSLEKSVEKNRYVDDRFSHYIEKDIAKEIIQFFWVSVDGDFAFPISHIEVASITGKKLLHYFWDGVKKIDEVYSQIKKDSDTIRPRVVFSVFDGAGENDSFINLQNNKTYEGKKNKYPGIPWKVWNEITLNDLYLIPDCPHILKKGRNSIKNSTTRNYVKMFSSVKALKRGGSPIGWEFMENALFREKMRFIPETGLNESHVYLNNRDVMNVSRATKIFTFSLMEDINENENEFDTEGILWYMNCYYEIKKIYYESAVIKHDSQPMKELKRISEDFKEWKNEISRDLVKQGKMKKKDGFPCEDFISKNLYTSVIMYCNGVPELSEYLFSRFGLYLNPHKINQDYNENWFSMQRGLGRDNTNPTVKQYRENQATLFQIGVFDMKMKTSYDDKINSISHPIVQLSRKKPVVRSTNFRKSEISKIIEEFVQKKEEIPYIETDAGMKKIVYFCGYIIKSLLRKCPEEEKTILKSFLDENKSKENNLLMLSPSEDFSKFISFSCFRMFKYITSKNVNKYKNRFIEFALLCLKKDNQIIEKWNELVKNNNSDSFELYFEIQKKLLKILLKSFLKRNQFNPQKGNMRLRLSVMQINEGKKLFPSITEEEWEKIDEHEKKKLDISFLKKELISKKKKPKKKPKKKDKTDYNWNSRYYHRKKKLPKDDDLELRVDDEESIEIQEHDMEIDENSVYEDDDDFLEYFEEEKELFSNDIKIEENSVCDDFKECTEEKENNVSLSEKNEELRIGSTIPHCIEILDNDIKYENENNENILALRSLSDQTIFFVITKSEKPYSVEFANFEYEPMILYNELIKSIEKEKEMFSNEVIVALKELLYPTSLLGVNIRVDFGRITKNCILRLVDGCWLNDEIINGYINVLKIHYDFCFSSSFFFFNLYYRRNEYSFEEVKNDFKSRYFNFNVHVIPIHINHNHWCLIIINHLEGIVYYYDSIHSRSNERFVCKNIKKFLTDIYKLKKKKKKKYKFERNKSKKQENNFDCGAFLLANCRSHFVGEECKNQKEISDKFRLIILKSLLYRKIF